MNFKKGTKVEVLEKGYASLGSWRPARILSGSGHIYVLKYDGCSVEMTMRLNKVPRKMLRPAPPPSGLKGLAIGDVVEVLDNSSWKLAEVMKLHSRGTVIMELLGTSNVSVAPRYKLRMPLTWKDDHWIAFEKESLKCEDVNVNKQSKVGRLSNHIPLLTTGKQTCGQLDRFAENYGDFGDYGHAAYIGRTSKRLRVSIPPVYAHTGVCRDNKEIKKKARSHRLDKQNATHQLLEKVAPSTFSGSNLLMGLDLSDDCSAASCVGSCSIKGCSNSPVCYKASQRLHFEDAGSRSGCAREQSCFEKDAMSEAIHSLELDAYRSNLSFRDKVEGFKACQSPTY